MQKLSDTMKMLNNIVTKNLKEMNRESDILNADSYGINLTDSETEKANNINFIIALVEYYKNIPIQSGGKSKKISSELDDYTNNDSFRVDKEIYDTQDRMKQDPKTKEMYKDILKKIEKLLNVDEETAKLYRSGLKRDVILKNPELGKRSNDAKKIETIEKIVDNKTSLENAIKNIDIKAIKKYIEQRKEESKNRSTMSIKTPEKTVKNTTTSSQMSSSSNPISSSTTISASNQSSTSQSITPVAKPKEKKSKQKRVTNHYIESDELIF